MSADLLQAKLWPEDAGFVPCTEGIKYAGSKLKLLSQILQLVHEAGARSILDGFSGSTRVAQALARAGHRVIANDTSVWSEVLGSCYLSAQPNARHDQLIRHLNECKPKDGWFSHFYGGDARQSSEEGTISKRPWQLHNTRKLDGIREEIDRLQLDFVTRSVALTSLMLALDRVDSTMGHFSSYLREWSPRSYKKMHLTVPNMVSVEQGTHRIVKGDVFDVAPSDDVELAYYDPPYRSNNEKMPPSRVRYAAYYHIWTTICLNDQPPLFGKAHRRIDSRDHVSASVFEEFRKNESGQFLAVEAIQKLLARTKAKHVLLSYSSGGRATAYELTKILTESGDIVKVIETDYKKNVMAGMTWTKDWLRHSETSNKEFLFLLTRN